MIFAGIGSLSGKELAFATKSSASLLIKTDDELRSNYSKLVATIINAYQQAAISLGKVNRIVTTFENLKCIVIPYPDREAFVIVLTTRDSESNTIAFQISKLVERFTRS